MSNIGNANKVNKKQVRPNGGEEHEEHVVVANTHTVVQPLAVVIKSVNAFVADVAVSRLHGSQDLTCWTDVAWVEELVHLQETHLC